MQEIVPTAKGQPAEVAVAAADKLSLSAHSCELVKKMNVEQAAALHAASRPWGPQALLSVRLLPEAMSLLAADWLQHEWAPMVIVLRFAEDQGEAGESAVPRWC
jgi:hypothetical protein